MRSQAEPRANSEPTPVLVATASARYEIRIGSGLLHDPDAWVGLPRAGLAVIVSNPEVAALYGAALRAALAPHFGRVGLLLLPDGEAHKNAATLERIYDHLLGEGADRRTVLVALGGGVVGDMTGFAAATFMRGVPFVQVPTTLLAQVDSSVGGKTAINHPRGKNMIGAFHQPVRVVCDLDTLATLPQRELAAGLAEVVKYGPVADADFYGWLEDNMDALVGRDAGALAHAVRRSCEIKAEIVAADEREGDGGRRATLNFGHTFGHAIETGVGYGHWLHGEAVACGMVMAMALSAALGTVAEPEVGRLRRLLQRAGLPVLPPALPAERWLQLMRLDKKAIDGDIRFVLVHGIGRAQVQPVPDGVVRQVLVAFGSAPGVEPVPATAVGA